MKRFALILIFFSIANISRAQIYFGIDGGVNRSNISTVINGQDDGYKSSYGYIINSSVNIPVKANLILQSGLQYESYRSKIDVTNTSSTYRETLNGKLNIEFLNIPIKLLYHLNAGKNTFFVGAGTYVGIGLSGHVKGSVISEINYGGGAVVKDTNLTDESVRFGSSTGYLKRLNAGVSFQASYVTQSSIFFSLYSNIGLTNLSNQQKTSTRTASLGATVGYLFGRKIKNIKR